MSKTTKTANNKSSNISSDVLEQIKGGQIQMHPDWYFALLASGFAIAVASILSVAIYAINLSLLRLEIAREGATPWLLGRYYFDAHHLPLGFLFVAALAIGGVVYLLHHRSHYTRALPEWSIVLGVVVFTACLGLALSRSPINRNLERSGPFRPFYEQQRPIVPNRERNLPPAL